MKQRKNFRVRADQTVDYVIKSTRSPTIKLVAKVALSKRIQLSKVWKHEPFAKKMNSGEYVSDNEA